MKNRYNRVNELQREFVERKAAINKRITDFAAVAPHEYFYELVYCLLTPQSSAVNAEKAVERLRNAGLHCRDVDPVDVLCQKDHYIRFHNTKARHIQQAKEQLARIQSALNNGSSTEELRAWLVKNVRGLGWKEASHFLRNIGHRDLAILDRHILRNLKRHGVIRSLPATLTPKRYLGIERKFREFSRAVGISLDELDLLFWSRETGQILK
jgi:N-glycosylase/DNA lyase